MRDMKITIIAEFFLHNPLTQVMYFLTSRYRHIPHESQKNPTFCCQIHIYNARIIQIHYYLRVRAHRGVSSYFIITRQTVYFVVQIQKNFVGEVRPSK